MAEILAEIYSWISFVPKITFKNLIEIAIIAILVYEMLIWIKNTRAWTCLLYTSPAESIHSYFCGDDFNLVPSDI